MLAYLRKGETFAELAAGFGVGTATAWRYVNETVGLLAARAPKLHKAVRDAKKKGHAYVVVDGTNRAEAAGRWREHVQLRPLMACPKRKRPAI